MIILNNNNNGMEYEYVTNDGKAELKCIPLDEIVESSFDIVTSGIPGNCRDILEFHISELNDEIKKRTGMESPKSVFLMRDSRLKDGKKYVVGDGSHYVEYLKRQGKKNVDAVICKGDFANEEDAWNFYCKISVTLNRNNLTYPEKMRIIGKFNSYYDNLGIKWKKEIERMTGISNTDASPCLSLYRATIELNIFDDLVIQKMNENNVRIAIAKAKKDKECKHYTDPKTDEERAEIEFKSTCILQSALRSEIAEIIKVSDSVKKSKGIIKELSSKQLVLKDYECFLDKIQYEKLLREISNNGSFFNDVKTEIDEITSFINNDGSLKLQKTFDDFNETNIKLTKNGIIRDPLVTKEMAEKMSQTSKKIDEIARIRAKEMREKEKQKEKESKKDESD